MPKPCDHVITPLAVFKDQLMWKVDFLELVWTINQKAKKGYY